MCCNVHGLNLGTGASGDADPSSSSKTIHMPFLSRLPQEFEDNFRKLSGIYLQLYRKTCQTNSANDGVGDQGMM